MERENFLKAQRGSLAGYQGNWNSNGILSSTHGHVSGCVSLIFSHSSLDIQTVGSSALHKERGKDILPLHVQVPNYQGKFVTGPPWVRCGKLKKEPDLATCDGCPQCLSRFLKPFIFWLPAPASLCPELCFSEPWKDALCQWVANQKPWGILSPHK